MTDFQRVSLDFAGLFLFAICFILAVHFRSYGMIAAFFFFGAVGFFASLMSFSLGARGYEVGSYAAFYACLAATFATAISFVLIFLQAVA